MTETYWMIYCGKREYKLTVAEHERVKQSAKNNQTMVWFENFVISIPHISSMERVREHKDEVPQLDGPVLDPAIASKKIAEIKSQIKMELKNEMSFEELEKTREKLRKQAEMLS
jgi:hypothetical protein